MIDKPSLEPGPHGAIQNTFDDELKLLREQVHQFYDFCIKLALQLEIVPDGKK